MKKPVPFSLVYEDGDIIAVNKASGISVGPDRWDPTRQRLDTLIAAMVNADKPDASRLFIVHRIDHETSGLVVFAKNETAHRHLSVAFETRQVTKRYIAIVHGRPSWEEITCELPLIPDGNKQHQTIVDKYRGKKSLTHFTLLDCAAQYSVLEALPQTGRTHQIRVHAAALGFPVVCDPLYGTAQPVFLSAIKKNWRGDTLEEQPLLARLGLHAQELILPAGGGCITLQAPLPRDMDALKKQLEKLSKKHYVLSKS